MKIKSLSLQAFRGFLEKFTFNFYDADVLLLYGPNGHGKTSIFDSIEWVLTGEIHRFSVSTDERNRTRFVRNLNAESTRETYVSLVLQISLNRVAEVTRLCTVKPSDTSDYGKSTLEILIKSSDGSQEKIKGDAAENVLRKWLVKEAWRDNVEETSRIIALTHILGQEKLNEFVRGMRDGDRYKSLSILFGTEHFMKYRESFKEILDLLKEHKQQKEGRLQEVRHSIKSLNNSIDRLGEKIRFNESIPLKEVLLPYIKYFDNVIHAYNQEQWHEVKEICVHNQEQLKKERYDLENTTRQFKELQDLIENWKECNGFMRELPSTRKRLNQFLNYKEKLDVAENLIKQLPRFWESERNKKTIQEEIKKTNLEASEHQTIAVELEEFIGKLDNHKGNILKKREFEETLDIYDSRKIDEKLKRQILNHIFNLKSIIKILDDMQKSRERNKNNIDGLEKAIKELQGIDSKHQVFLNALNDYISIHSDIEDCPACGTKGISELDLKKRIVNEQGKMNEALPELEAQISKNLSQLQTQNVEIERLKEQLDKEEKEINKILKMLGNKAVESRNQSIKLKHHEQQLYNEIQVMEKFLTKFYFQAKKLHLNVERSSFKKSLFEIRGELQTKLSTLSLKEQMNLQEQLIVLERQEQQAKEDINRFFNRLMQLDIKAANIDRENEEDVLRFFRDFSKQHTTETSKLKKKEEISLKVLNALEYANDELQLVELQTNIEKQRNKYKVLKTDYADITSDSQAVQNVMDNIKNALDGLNDKMMDQLFDTIDQIFTRINSHPMYSRLKFTKEHRNRAYRLLIYVLSGEEKSEAANASYIFSSAQVNSIALSFFISMSLHQNWSPLQLMGMDDPIQSMDEINTVAFIDLIRLFIEKHNKQIIISTHDYTFYKMMLRKFRFQNVAVIEYEGYSQNGPSIKKYEDDTDELVQYYQKECVEELNKELIKLDCVL